MGRTFASRAALLFSLLFVAVSAVAGATIHVPANKPTIQAGINAYNNEVSEGHGVR